MCRGSGGYPRRWHRLIYLVFHLYALNPCYANSLVGNIKMCSHFLSFLNSEAAWIIESLCHGRQTSLYPSQSVYWFCWRLGDARNQGIGNRGINLILQEHSIFSMRRLNLWQQWLLKIKSSLKRSCNISVLINGKKRHMFIYIQLLQINSSSHGLSD